MREKKEVPRVYKKFRLHFVISASPLRLCHVRNSISPYLISNFVKSKILTRKTFLKTIIPILTHFEVKHFCNFLSLFKFFSLSAKGSTLWSLWCLRLPAGCLPAGCLPAGQLPMSYSLWLAARIILQSILTQSLLSIL